MTTAKFIIYSLVFTCLLSVACLVTVVAKSIDLSQEVKHVKEQRDQLRHALIKGNGDIIKARKIIEANKIVIL